MGRAAVVGLLLVAACSPGEGPESIPLPTSPDTTTTTSTTTTTTTTTLVPARFEAEIRRTTNGVPHITGETPADVAYGQGWVSGEDHGCTLIDQVLKVTSTRSAALGPGAEGENADSDFAWKAIGIAEIAAADFENASSEVVEQFEAFTAGWNDQLADVGGERLTGWCAGADWIRPITAVEVYTYARSLALLASSGAIIEYIGSAQPPAAEPAAMRSRPATPGDPATIDLDAVADADLGLVRGAGLASNGWAVGKDRTVGNDGGLLLANPHFPWEGELRFAEVQLTVAGQADVYGAQLLGLPGVGDRVHRGRRLDAHRVGRQPDDGLSLVPRPRLADLLRRRRAAGADELQRCDDRHPAPRRHRRHRDPDPVAQRVRTRSSTSRASAGPTRAW